MQEPQGKEHELKKRKIFNRICKSIIYLSTIMNLCLQLFEGYFQGISLKNAFWIGPLTPLEPLN